MKVETIAIKSYSQQNQYFTRAVACPNAFMFPVLDISKKIYKYSF